MHFELRWYADGAVNLLIEVWDSNASSIFIKQMRNHFLHHNLAKTAGIFIYARFNRYLNFQEETYRPHLMALLRSLTKKTKGP